MTHDLSEIQESGLPDLGLELHHVGIVVQQEERMITFARAIGFVEFKREHLPKYHVTNIFFRSAVGAKGPLVQFAIPTRGTLKNFNSGKGGLHHIAFETDDIERTQREMEAKGFRFIAASPQIGVDGLRFNFVSPNVEGMNVEIVQEPEGWRGTRDVEDLSNQR
jgi:methylmalonyl-CoA/ethylmalonyl-CoA epimerase